MGDLPDGLYKIKSLKHDKYAENWPDNDPGIGIGNYFPNSKRNIWKITRTRSSNSTYTIESADDGSKMTFIDRRERPALRAKGSDTNTTWKIVNDGAYVKFYPDGDRFRSLAVDMFEYSGYSYLCLLRNDNNSRGQCWDFQRVDESPAPKLPNTSSASFQSQFFPLSAEKAKESSYDIIVVGTGIGGGVLAGDLFDTNIKLGESGKSVLVIERGDLVFHSHCLNTARPVGLGKDRGQQNDSFFASFKKDYVFTDQKSRDLWKGGPMYCLGGRSAAWGLFAPRVHDDTLKDFFPESVTRELLNEYYEKAEILMNLSLPETRALHQHLMERLNMDSDAGVGSRLNVPNPDLKVQWQWGRIASEFSQSQNFDFAEGAYSTIDKLLEIAMSPKRPKFDMLLGAEARSLTWTGPSSRSVKGVMVRTATGDHEIKVTPGSGRVVLCAGSVASPTILLRSLSEGELLSMGGCHLTDHDIIFRAKSFRYTNPAVRREIGSMKLQTYVDLGKGNVVLANMSIDASSFLPRGRARDNTLPKFIMVFIMRAPLRAKNLITLGVDGEPQVTIRRSPARQGPNQEENDRKKLNALTESTMETIQRVLQIEFVDQEGETNDFKSLELGGVAHELGTVPMPMGEKSSDPYCVDSDLKLQGREGVYVCDLSVFPYSPEANPTLTLAALSLRLSRHLLPRLNVKVTASDTDTVHVVNHSGQKFRVWVSNRARVSTQDAGEKGVELEPGKQVQWKRKNGVHEAALVYRCDQTENWKYVKVPELFVAQPGKVLAVM